MNGHLSQLVLDELAARLPAPAEAKVHLDACAECTARLKAIEADRAAVMSSFGYSRVKARVTGARPPRWRELMPLIVPLAAGLIFFAVVTIDWRPDPDTERLKGGAFVELVQAGRAVTEVQPGARLGLKIGTSGKQFALVLAVDKDRRIEQLWSGKLPVGAVVTLPKELEVTPGSVTVHAFLGDAPPEPKVVLPALESSLLEYAGWPLEAPPPKIDGLVVASRRLYVKP